MDEESIPRFRLATLLKLARLKEQVLKDAVAKMEVRRTDMARVIAALQAERQAGYAGSQKAGSLETRVEYQHYLRGLALRVREESAALEAFEARIAEVKAQLTAAAQDRLLLEKHEVREARRERQKVERSLQEELDEIGARLHEGLHKPAA